MKLQYVLLDVPENGVILAFCAIHRQSWRPRFRADLPGYCTINHIGSIYTTIALLQKVTIRATPSFRQTLLARSWRLYLARGKLEEAFDKPCRIVLFLPLTSGAARPIALPGPFQHHLLEGISNHGGREGIETHAAALVFRKLPRHPGLAGADRNLA